MPVIHGGIMGLIKTIMMAGSTHLQCIQPIRLHKFIPECS